MMKILNKTTLKNIFIILAFLAVLLSIRWAWLTHYATPEHPPAVQGVIDLRGWDIEQSPSITLDGEWEFYPSTFLSHGELTPEMANASNYIQVPSDWRAGFPEAKDSSYGYGTYRLRILVDQPLYEPYTLWIQEIQAASKVQINGKDIPVFGTLGENKESYSPKEVSYIAHYENAEAKEIEVLIQVANFDKPTVGGIARSIRFGSQAAIDTERMYSVGFQLVTFVILLLHGLYAFILFLFNRREKAFLTFFLLLFTAGITVVSDHDKILLLWFPIDYSWSLKIRLLSYIWLTFFILLLSYSIAERRIRSKLFYLYAGAVALYSIFTLIAPTELVYYSRHYRIFTILYFIPLPWSIFIFVKMVIGKRKDSIFLLLAITSIGSSIIWGALNITQVIEPLHIYYPIEVIAAIISFSAYWFKRYLRNAKENAQLNAQLREADKLKDQFLANTSHELRTPLHAIMNIAQSIVDKEKRHISEKSAKDMNLLITISRRMSHLLDDLLDVIRLQDKRIVLNKEPIRIQPLVAGVVSMLNFMTEGKPIKLKIDIPDTLPAIIGDEKRLIQILFNLVHNAVKYTDEGSITVSAEVKHKRVTVRVADQGIGMDEEALRRIFLPYEQGNHRESSGGIGLGLSICKQLVELHGSELKVKSVPNKGSVFSFALPLATVMQKDSSSMPLVPERSEILNQEEIMKWLLPRSVQSAEWSAPPFTAPSFAGRSLNILAVDDDQVNLKVLSSLIGEEQVSIFSVTSGREALELLGTRQWDLLIIDVMMPHMSGYELTKRVREHFSISELPILLLTARSQPADIYTGFLSGANDYVTKPVDALELKYRIWSLTTLKQSIDERLRMEAAYLQAQIHPHFLFNTLNSILALSDIDTDKMRDLGDAFSSYLRISFDFLNSAEHVELEHELELVQAYLYIEQERFPDRLAVEWEVDPSIDIKLPPLTIQPLVENAVRHGLLSTAKGGTVFIRIARQEQAVIFEVQDNGKGMAQEKVEQLLRLPMKGKGGIGLFNTNQRLTQKYGKGLVITSKPGEGTNVSFTIPDQG